MANIKIIKQESAIKDNTVVITQTNEQVLTFEELQTAIFNIQRQKAQLIRQSQEISRQFCELDAREKELQTLLQEIQPIKIEPLI